MEKTGGDGSEGEEDVTVDVMYPHEASIIFWIRRCK